MRKNLINMLNPKRKEVKMMKKLTLLLVTMLLVVFAGSAYAQPITLFTDQISKLKFTDFEILVDNNNNGRIDTGDQLAGILNVTSIDNVASTQNQNLQLATKELTGIFVLDVVAGDLPATIGAAGHLDLALLSGDFLALYVGEGATKNFDSTGTIAQGFATASDGTLWAAILGTGTLNSATTGTETMNDPLDPGVNYVGINNTAIVGTTAVSINQNWTNLSLNQTGYTILPQDWPELTGESGAHTYLSNNLDLFGYFTDVYFENHLFLNSGAGKIGDWDFRSEDPAYVWATTIPEPSTLLLLGLGLFGIGITARKRLKK
jgi:hypothetical protein